MANPPARSDPSPFSTYAFRSASSFCAKCTTVRSSRDLDRGKRLTVRKRRGNTDLILYPGASSTGYTTSYDTISLGGSRASLATIRTDGDPRNDLAKAAVEVEEHAKVIVLVDRLLEYILGERCFVYEAGCAREAKGRVCEDDRVGCVSLVRYDRSMQALNKPAMTRSGASSGSSFCRREGQPDGVHTSITQALRPQCDPFSQHGVLKKPQPCTYMRVGTTLR